MRAGRDRALEAALDLVRAGGEGFPGRVARTPDPSLDLRLPLADSLGAWIDDEGLEPVMDRFDRVRADTSRWFLAEDWEYGDLTTLGARLMKEGRIEESVVVLEAAAEAYPNSYRPHAWLHRAHGARGRQERSRVARKRALELNPRLFAEDERAAIELEGRVPLSHEFLERVFSRGPETAIHHYREVMAADPTHIHVNPLLMVRAGQQLREAGQLEPARRVFAFVAGEFPDWTVGHLGLAEVARSLGEEERALEAYRKVLRIDPEHFRAREMVPRE